MLKKINKIKKNSNVIKKSNIFTLLKKKYQFFILVKSKHQLKCNKNNWWQCISQSYFTTMSKNLAYFI